MKKYIALAVVSIILTGCSNSDPSASLATFMSKESQLQTRQHQIKSFKATKETLLKVSINTLQDDNYIIQHSDNNLGLVSATKKDGKNISKISMQVQEIDATESKLRMNIEISEENVFGSSNTKEIDKLYYKYIFDRVSKSLFLEEALSIKQNHQDKLDIKPLDSVVKSVVPETMVITKPQQVIESTTTTQVMPMQTQSLTPNSVPQQIQMPNVGFNGSILTPQGEQMLRQQQQGYNQQQMYNRPQQGYNQQQYGQQQMYSGQQGYNQQQPMYNQQGYTNQPQQKAQPTNSREQKRVVTKNNNFISNNVDNTNLQVMQPQQMSQQANQQSASMPNPDAALQYNYNPQTQGYDYYKGY